METVITAFIIHVQYFKTETDISSVVCCAELCIEFELFVSVKSKMLS